ncbi:TetR/AcrR family transcriptional regulator [Dactylosporangium sp. NPDC000521]|uniref:TetR/AcrR family transcriptional regulator n=1 Tax=Dactylosporangium sp. NPDC000521 TaxID=3363975 RepID=UPI00368D445A
MKATSIRARVRAEMTEEIKAIARRHLATDGANLSLRAVARDLGVVSSAIYRYFASRDDLLTALILDAYNSLGQTVEDRERAVGRDDLTGRWMAVCDAVRGWALERPHEYALIYGSPVPGYQAPTDTVAAATRAVTVLGTIIQDAAVARRLPPGPREPVPDAVAADVRRAGAMIAPDVPDAVTARALSAWVTLFGLVSFEVFGQLNNVVEHRGEFFEHQMRAQARFVGLEFTEI